MATADNSKFTDAVTLRQVVKDVQFEFPMILKTNGSNEDYEILNPELNDQLPENSLLMLESQVNIPYAHIKVLDLADNEAKTVELKGGEYVREYNQFVGQEFLIPVKFKNKVKIIHRPGTRTRFTDISEVLHCLPRYLKVGANTWATRPETGETVSVPEGITIEVNKPILVSDITFLECTSSDRQLYWFSSDAVVNFTEVDDQESYSLEHITSKMLLPRVVKFENSISPDDVVVYNDTWAYNTMVMTYGPMEVIGIKRKYHLIGWLRVENRGIVSFRRVLVPISQWDHEIVQFRNFTTTKERDAFCDKKFKMCRNSVDYENKLYIIPIQSNGITYLRGKQTLNSGYGDDSSDDSEDYEKPMTSQVPAVPPRRPIRTHSDETPGSSELVLLPERILRPDVLQRIIDKAKLGFGFVHKELKHSFLAKQKAKKLAKDDEETPASISAQSRETPNATADPAPDSPTVNPPPPIPRIYSKVKKTNETKSEKPIPPPKLRPSSPKPCPSSPKPLPSSKTRLSSPKPIPSSQKQGPPTKPKPRLLAPGESGTPPKIPIRPPKSRIISYSQPGVKDEDSTQSDTPRYSQMPRLSIKNEKSTICDDDQPPLMPIPDRPPAPLPVQDHIDSAHEYDYPFITELMQCNVSLPNTPLYQKLTVAEVQKITRKNQTAKDFCSYSVQQVAECFALCALKGLGSVCMENKVDGAFLASYELDQLKEEPFLLSKFQIEKVKKIIQDGWRPSLR